MSRRGENIHKRKDGRWEARIKINNVKTGEKKYTSLYGRSYKEVKKKKADFIKNVKSDNPIQQKKLSEILNLWQENNIIRQKDATKLKYKFLIDQHINPEIGSILISDLDTTAINRFLYRKQQTGRLDHTGGLSPSSIKLIACILGSAVQFAAEQNYCKPFVCSLNIPPSSKKELTILDIENQIKLENYIMAYPTHTGAGILLSLNTGLRIGEVCALRWDEFDLHNKVICIKHTVSRVPSTDKESGAKTCLIIEEPKTSASKRKIPIPSKLLPVLEEMHRQALSDFVISDKVGFVSPRTYEYRYHKILKECNVSKVNYHALRHTFATRCIEVGMDIKTLSELMGHSNVNITLNTYVHSSIDLKRTQIEKLSNLSDTIE